jgi:hypothetical protein
MQAARILGVGVYFLYKVKGESGNLLYVEY